MKFKTTAKAIRNDCGEKLAISYCGAHYLLRGHSPVAYTAGVYGWNFDVYIVDGVTICTGYRGMVGKSVNYDLLREYENRARELWEDRCRTWEERSEAVEKVLREFIAEAVKA